MRRAGRRTAREIRRQRLEAARRNLGRYLVLAVFMAALASISMIWLTPMMRAFFAGVYVTAFFALLSYSLMLDGSHLRMMGAEAERWTSSVLRKSGGWWVMDHIEFDDRDVDHVAVGPAHVIAVETKWTSRTVSIDERGVHGLWCDGIQHAQRAADRTKRFLGSKGIRADVIALLVLWGPGVPQIPGGYQRVGDVRVVVGDQDKEWRERLDRLPRWSVSTEGVPPVIREYVERFDRHQRPSRGARAMRLALGEGSIIRGK